MCLRGMQVSQSGPARTHLRRRPPSCMIVTAMIVTVSPQWSMSLTSLVYNFCSYKLLVRDFLYIGYFYEVFMMTSSNGNIFRVTGPLCGEFTGPGEFPSQRPVTRSFDVFFDLHLNKRLSKQSRGWRFETPSRPLWRHCNGVLVSYVLNIN